MQHTQVTYRYRAYQSTAQRKGLARRQPTRAKNKTHTKSKQPRQTTIPIPELNLQKISSTKEKRKPTSKTQETKDSQIVETHREQTTKQTPN